MGSDRRQAFELVFLDAPRDIEELAAATTALHALSTAEFTDVAGATLEARGIAPGAQGISGRRSTWFSRASTTKYPGWRFEVYLPGKWTNARIQLWLLTDRRWGIATEPQVGTLMSTSSFQLADLTAEHQHYLIDARAGRVANWLERPKGKLNAAVE